MRFNLISLDFSSDNQYNEYDDFLGIEKFSLILLNFGSICFCIFFCIFVKNYCISDFEFNHNHFFQFAIKIFALGYLCGDFILDVFKRLSYLAVKKNNFALISLDFSSIIFCIAFCFFVKNFCISDFEFIYNHDSQVAIKIFALGFLCGDIISVIYAKLTQNR